MNRIMRAWAKRRPNIELEESAISTGKGLRFEIFGDSPFEKVTC